ncbi:MULTISPECIES: hypothetical protein [unclassified Thalassospira]|jgi:hypothetical protein|uniref:hypothetical protein n=1 Tax=unclassified Thalassospira TaxID=2648997 RepID=UPI001B280EE6|nr:hypothetical protein [Thalassospira sp.]MBO6773804.1 hypothetical protein [Thalassospira sp.]
MAEANPDKMNRAYNLLTGWHDKMDQASAGDGSITVNKSDVAELKQALDDLDELHSSLKTNSK